MGRALDPPLDHTPDLRELVHQVRLGVEPTGSVDDHDIVPSRAPGFDRVERDGGGIATRGSADEIGSRPLCPDLELLLRSGPKRVAGADENATPVLTQLLRQLADRRRLSRAVDAHDEDDRRRVRQIECRR